MTKRLIRKPGSRRSCCFPVLGLFLLIAIICSAVFTYLYSHPISNQALHERVLRRLERISGLTVSYDAADLTIATGQYHITNLRFIDPAEPEKPVLTVQDVLATIRPWQLLYNSESVITDVVLKNPSALDVTYSHDSIELGPRTRFLVDSVHKAQPPGSNPGGRLPFNEMKIVDLDLAFTEKPGILPDLEPPAPVMILDGDLLIKNASGSDLDLTFTGQAERPSQHGNAGTSATMASGVKASLLLKGAGGLNLDASATGVALSEVFREMPETSLKARNLKFSVAANSREAVHSLNGTVEAEEVAFISPENNLRVQDRNLHVKADLDLNTSSSKSQIRMLQVDSDGANGRLSGAVEYGPKRSYDVAIASDRVRQDYQVLLERLLPSNWDIQTEDNSLGVDLRIQGTETGVSAIDGKLSVRGVHVVSPAIPAALKNLHGDVLFSPQEIKLVDITGEYAGARVALDGSFTGDVWKAHRGKLAANWSTIVPLAEVIKLHGSQISDTDNKVSGSGTISGHGTWNQELDLANPSASTVPHVEGEVEFKDVGLNLDALPAPIAGLNGVTRVIDNRLVVDHLSGAMQGNELKISGELWGRDFFWKDPQVSASLESRLDFAHLGPYLSPAQKANLEKYELAGHAETGVILQGPLKDVGSKFTGQVRVSDVSVKPGLEFMDGTFTGVSGIVAWDGHTMRLDEVHGELNGEAIAMAGDISASHLDIAIQSTPRLEAVEKTFPRLGHYLNMSGAMACDLALTAGKVSGEASTGTIIQMLEQARQLADSSVKDKTFSLNGELRFKDASIRHIAMPPARKENGRQIPEGRVTKLNGTVNVANDTISVPDSNPLNCSFADTPSCRLSGSIVLRQEDLPKMRVKISSAGTLKMDTWALGWGNAVPKPDQPPMTGKKFDLEAEISAPSVTFRGQEAGRSLAKLSFNMVQNETPRVTNFREVVIQGNRPGMGRVVGTGIIESFVWKPQQYPHWQTSLDVQAMPLESMLGAVFTEPSNMRGMVNGNLNIEGIGTNALSIRGQGSGFMRNLEIGGTAVIRELGQTTGRNFGGTLFQTAQAATFEIGNGALSSRDLALETNGLQLEMRGDYWFAGNPARSIAPKTIDGALRLRLFKSVFGSIPIIGQVAELADDMANAFLLAFRVSGTADNPQVTPIALPLFQGGT